VYKLSSNRRSGPVVPRMISGCPEKMEKINPAAEVAIRVSEIPMCFSVFSP
jgi:hypothetical protein